MYLLGVGQFIHRPFSHFEMQDFKNSKIFACSALIFNIHISDLRWIQWLDNHFIFTETSVSYRNLNFGMKSMGSKFKFLNYFVLDS